jgi:hypothetical protein
MRISIDAGIAAMSDDAPPADAGSPPDWRPSLRRKIVWLLVAKLVGLLLLWALFFSPSHRVEVTPEHAERILAIPPAPDRAPGGVHISQSTPDPDRGEDP